MEIDFPDGSRLRLRWTDDEKGIQVTAIRAGDSMAVGLAVLPRSSNGIVLLIE